MSDESSVAASTMPPAAAYVRPALGDEERQQGRHGPLVHVVDDVPGGKPGEGASVGGAAWPKREKRFCFGKKREREDS